MERRRLTVRAPSALALVVLILGVVATSFVTWWADGENDDSRQRQFDRLADGARDVISGRIERVTELLFGLQALFQPGEVSRAAFHEYVEGVEVDRLKGLQALSFNRAVAPEGRAAFEAAVRSDVSVRPQGYPEFQITGEPHAGELVVVDYVEPYPGNAEAHGFDVRSESVRRIAVDEARDRGHPIATRGVDLLQGAEEGDDTGILVALPVYTRGSEPQTGPERRRAFEGVVVAVIEVGDLLADALGSKPLVGFEIYDVGPTVGKLRADVRPSDLLFDPDENHGALDPGSARSPNRFLDLDVGGRRWRIFAESLRPIPGASSRVPVVGAAVSGIAVTVLAMGVVSAAASVRARRRRELFEGYLEFTPDAVVVTDRQGIITSVNARLEEMFGYQKDDLVGKPVEVLIPPELGSRHVEHRTGFAAAPRTRPMGVGLPLVGRHRDGTDVPVEVSLSPLESGAGPVFAAAVRDVTERRRAEEALREALEHEHEAARRLREVDALKDEFLDITAHELRTPLTAVLGFSELLIRRGDTMDPERSQDVLSRIEANATEMREMVNRLLDLSRLRAGRVILHPEEVELGSALQRVASRPRANGSDHSLVVEVEPGVRTVVDPNAFDHVLSNLVSNALKFAPSGSEVRVIGRRAGRDVVVSVVDQGPGIAPEDLPRLFDRFFQGADQVPGTRGVGVGLSIVKRYVELWGGRIWVETEPGAGATFSFTVPDPGTGVVRSGEDADG